MKQAQIQKINDMVQQAAQAQQSGDLPRAEKLYEKIVKAAPNQPNLMHQAALVCLQLGRHAKGLNYIKQTIRLAPDKAFLFDHQGIMQCELGMLAEAEASWKKATELDDKYVPAFLNWAKMLHENGRPAEAVDLCLKAIALDKNSLDGFFNLGLAYFKLEQVNDALAAWQAALRINPNHVQILNNIGNALTENANAEDAEPFLRKAVTLKPDYHTAWNTLGNCLKDLGRAQEAEEAYLKAVSLKPDQAEYHLALGGLMLITGEQDKAIAYTRKAMDMAPDLVAGHLTLAQTKKYSANDIEIPQMEKKLAQMVKRKEEKAVIALHYALAKAYDDIKDFDKAFDHYKQANDLRRAKLPYSTVRQEENFARIKQVFSAEFITEHKDAGIESDVPVFILGMPRSGTSLVEQILASHPQLFGAGEIDALQRLLPADIGTLNAASLHEIGEKYLERLKRFAPDAKRISNKTPINFMWAGVIRLALPHARIIHCLRDPVDTCLSCYKQMFTFGQHWSHDLTELGHMYRLYDDLSRHWRAILPAERYYEIRYEDLVEDTEKYARELVDFVGLEWDPSCLEFYKTKRVVNTASKAQVRQPIYKSSVKKWQVYEHHLQPLLAELKDIM